MAKTREEIEQDILQSAKKVFLMKGYDGARMRDIAAEANVNLALLHYYFKSKDNLFEKVFEDVYKLVFNNILSVLDNKVGLFETIRMFVDKYMTFLMQNPLFPNFILNEITTNPERLILHLKKHIINNDLLEQLQDKIDRKAKKGTIVEIEVIDLILNVISLCIFPILIKPGFRLVFDMPDELYNNLLENRKQHVANFVINSLKK